MLKLAVLTALLWVGASQGAEQTNLQARDLDLSLPGHEAVYDQARNITWLADPAASGFVTYRAATAWAEALTVGSHSDWRISDGVELLRLWEDWRAASLAEFGDEFFTDPSTSSDAGIRSSLFTSDGMRNQYWDRATDGFWVALWSFERHWSDQGVLWIDTPNQSGAAWAIHPGDIGVAITPEVPEPHVFVGLAVGLAALTLLRRWSV